jgi:hypothetical protein
VWWAWIVAGIVLLGAAAAAVSAAGGLRRRRRRYVEAAKLWRETPGERRLDALRGLLSNLELHGPAWYLIGVEHLRAGDTKEAARAFGMAHHADCDLESAALLAFACLKAAPGAESDIVEQIIATWREMKQPALPARDAERRLLACVEETDRHEAARREPRPPSPPDLPALGRLAWLVVGPAVRPKVERVFADPPPP